MEAGTVFFFTLKDEHPWVVLSDPKANPESVLIVNLTSWRDFKEQTCIIESHEHSCVTKKSCVYYEGGTITSLNALLEAKDCGVLKLERDPMPQGVMRRMVDGAARSDNVSGAAKALLRGQGRIA